MILKFKLVSHDKESLDAAIKEMIEDDMYCQAVHPDDWDYEKEWREENAQEFISNHLVDGEIEVDFNPLFKRFIVRRISK